MRNVFTVWFVDELVQSSKIVQNIMTMLLSKIVFSFHFLYPSLEETKVMGQAKHV